MESIPTDHQGFLTAGQFFENEKKFQTPMHKVQMTQRGYIQFLRWGISVPEIREFTFCLWMHSTNMTYAQSFFSYSKNEMERQIRSWIGPGGQRIFLEINNKEIFAFPISMDENHWYHLCQSWRSEDGRYGLWINGRLETEGFSKETIGHVIPSKGDIVVGQEFTDFDKGLEDGIEGSVLGFNFLLSSAFHSQETTSSSSSSLTIPPAVNIFSPFQGILTTQGFIRTNAQGLIDSNNINRRSLYLQKPFVFHRTNSQSPGIVYKEEEKNPFVFRKTSQEEEEKIVFGEEGENNLPLGLQLIIISHSHCEIGRGSPFIGGHLMLISWTRTPVRVFGGAIVKPVKSVCGYF